MRTRALGALRTVAWWASIALAVVWWAPSLTTAADALLFGWMRFGCMRFALAIGLGRALVAVGCPMAAAWVYGTEMARAERRMRAIRRRRH